MLSAILTTLFAIVILGIIAVVVFRVRAGSSQQRARERMRVKSVTSVGIAAEQPKTSSASGQTPVAGSSSGSSENLRSRFAAVGVIVSCLFGVLAALLFGLQIVEGSNY